LPASTIGHCWLPTWNKLRTGAVTTDIHGGKQNQGQLGGTRWAVHVHRPAIYWDHTHSGISVYPSTFEWMTGQVFWARTRRICPGPKLGSQVPAAYAVPLAAHKVGGNSQVRKLLSTSVYSCVLVHRYCCICTWPPSTASHYCQLALS
jgi:hypothetical protein